MIQGNVSAHASFQTRVLLEFYLQQLPWGRFNLLPPFVWQTGRREGCATAGGSAMGTGTGDKGQLLSRD